MLKRKKIREQGKLPLSRYFQKFAEGEIVAIIRDHSEIPKFPKRIQGMTGIISGMQGKSYFIKVQDGNKEKLHLIRPVHLKKLTMSNK